jgi:hypothetical protein
MSAGPETVFEFTLFLQGPMVTSTVTTPAGWAVSDSPTFVDWFAIDPAQEIAPGTSLDGFTFSSLETPGAATFVTIGIDDLGNVVVTSDSTLGPSPPVPEPSTGALFILSAMTMLLLRKKSVTSRAFTPDAISRMGQTATKIG